MLPSWFYTINITIYLKPTMASLSLKGIASIHSERNTRFIHRQLPGSWINVAFPLTANAHICHQQRIPSRHSASEGKSWVQDVELWLPSLCEIHQNQHLSDISLLFIQ